MIFQKPYGIIVRCDLATLVAADKKEYKWENLNVDWKKNNRGTKKVEKKGIKSYKKKNNMH